MQPVHEPIREALAIGGAKIERILRHRRLGITQQRRADLEIARRRDRVRGEGAGEQKQRQRAGAEHAGTDGAAHAARQDAPPCGQLPQLAGSAQVPPVQRDGKRHAGPLAVHGCPSAGAVTQRCPASAHSPCAQTAPFAALPQADPAETIAMATHACDVESQRRPRG